MILYAQTQGSHSTNSGAFTPIPGLSLTLPEGVKDTGLIILNVPNPYATGNNYPGGIFAISVGGVVQAPTASFTYNEQVPPATGRIPTTLVVGVPLATKAQPVLALWQNVRGSNVIIDSPASLSIIF
jgi:hypothetical protein